ncbi:MAG: TIGR02611 family protein [Gordonia sp. (in: high G+C Gram-positive bacteria)]|uniref:TIGR02611 family protein n=1 Tax=Gordonia sp. (in: high G+C Gram-positive bacteria) TaxID=84139 RepID=UPI0039E4594A
MRLRIKIWHRRNRYAIRQNPVLNQAYRFAVGIVGTVMMLAGMVMIPLPVPGPGWVTLFLGLAVLSTEFTWAHRVTAFLRRRLHDAAVLSARLTTAVRGFLRHNHAYHRHTMVPYARTAYLRISPLPAPA